MKRSVAVSLVLLGTGIALSACGEERQVDAAAYKNSDECIADGKFSREDCIQDYQAALGDFTTTSPQFENQADCEAQFGAAQCQPKPDPVPGSTHSSFVPFMTGYMMGNHSSSSPVRIAPQALYTPRGQSNFVNSEGTTLSKGLGMFKMTTRSTEIAAPSTRSTGVFSKGGSFAKAGFGSRAVFGSFGS